MTPKTIVVAGGTGNLGSQIVRALLNLNTHVKVLVRATSNPTKTQQLQQLGATVVCVDETNVQQIADACRGAHCVVSALAGLEQVIIDAQTALLNGAVLAGVPRFIPSDYSTDFTKFSHGENRNLDIRRKFHTVLNAAPIAATTIFNGAFMDMLTNEIPMIIVKRKLVLYWGNAHHNMCFTTVNNTAMFTAHVALEEQSPRYLHIAGQLISAAEIKDVMTELSGQRYRLIKTGSLGMLSLIIKIARRLAPSPNNLYPAWQGMQYMRNMMDQRATLTSTDNNRYPHLTWTSVKELIARHNAINNRN